MVLAKSKQQVGLGNALMNDRFGKGKKSEMHKGGVAGNIKRTNKETGETYITNNKEDAAYMKMRSVTEQGALDEFLSTAELAGTDFTAEKMNNVKIIHKDQKNPYLLSAAEHNRVLKKHDKNRKRLTVPRRPGWDSSTTREELDTKERQALLEWRRGLAELQENQDLLLTPFERNLEVWRQLWRVIERSDLVVQIVDARNPLMFRSSDLENYVKEVDRKKRNLLLVNKADMMTHEQRTAWAHYFMEHDINFRFFSAELAKEMNEAKGLTEGSDDEADSESESESESEVEDELKEQIEQATQGDENAIEREARKVEFQEKQEEDGKWVDEATVDGAPESDTLPLSLEEATRILTTDDLEALFLQHSPKQVPNQDADAPVRKTQIGLVGYPNVGKSSTINALLGAKKVSVSATPGKTKHFQTIHLSEKVILCDCPGLVFPNFATTKAELTCNGVLPIDQLREYTGPATLVAQRIPQSFLEAIYGMKINIRPLEEGGTGTPTGEELLRAYARARGFQTQGLGQPDESRAARYVLKDYVKGKLLFCVPPPAEPPIDEREFNRELYDFAHLPEKRRARLAADVDSALTGTDDPSLMDPEADLITMPSAEGAKTRSMDKKFFAPGQGRGTVNMPFHHKYSEVGSAQVAETGGRMLTGRKAKVMTALENDMDLEDPAVRSQLGLGSSKKHFKAFKKREKKIRNNHSEYSDFIS
ncbi:hypothetical protein AAFC00_002720 [Neodothiora populina]|uniref:CP-type G domain-containing protein n=1 Tax=Neodothiora populina TaxID=2781224 RepID=A0ABR3P9A6_9PEZI